MSPNILSVLITGVLWPVLTMTFSIFTNIKKQKLFFKCYPISCLPTNSRVLEKFILKKINQDLNPQHWNPKNLFGLRQAHSTAQQWNSIRDDINKVMENQQLYSRIFRPKPGVR
jgi:hypothetical protein